MERLTVFHRILDIHLLDDEIARKAAGLLLDLLLDRAEGEFLRLQEGIFQGDPGELEGSISCFPELDRKTTSPVADRALITTPAIVSSLKHSLTIPR